MSVFWNLLLSDGNGPQAPPEGASGSQKAPKMEPNSDTFGYLWKIDFYSDLRCFLHF